MFSNRAAEGKRERLENVAAQITSKFKSKDREEFQHFASLLYSRLSPEDVMSMTVDNLYGAALSAWKFIAKRQPGEPLVRVCNPRVEEHGWKSSHTIVEILNSDMPFLFDSVSGALSFDGHQIHIACHPVLQVTRNDDGSLRALVADEGKDWGSDEVAESLMHLQINEQTDPDRLQQIEAMIREVLRDVLFGVSDWQAMLTRIDEATEELQGSKTPVDADELEEAVAFLNWLRDDHFTLLGCRDYSYAKRGKKDELSGIDGSGLGILRDNDRRVVASPRSGELAPIVQHFLRRSELTLITKTGVRGRVHRQVHMDYIGIKRYDAKGKLIGERRFVGLFTSSTYNHRVRDIPILRRKVMDVMRRAGLDPVGHDGKALVHILETFPRDELFQISATDLHQIAVGILSIQERSVIRLFARKDPFNRYYSCLIYVPREHHNTALQRKFEQILVEAMDGRISNYYTQVTDSVLARMHVIVGINNPLDPPPVDFDRVEERLIEAARSWHDHLHDVLVEEVGEESGNRLLDRYLDAFPTAYTEAFNADLAIGDIRSMEKLHVDGDIGMNFYRLIEDPEDQVRFKLFHHGGSVPLSDCLPMLENMGLRVLGETPYAVVFSDRSRIDIQDFHMVEATGQALDLSQLKGKLEAVFAKVWHGEVESDGFNRLVAKAGLHWREVVVLRALSKYLQQTAITYSQTYMQNTLASHPAIARLLIDLFNARFDPGLAEKTAKTEETRILGEIDLALEDVVSLDEDRIIRRFLNLIQVTLRTNYFQKTDTGEVKRHISFKMDSGAIEELPLPRPFREIFVYSSRVEGVHLRGGRVARGGLRWSDRPEDFRTEVLGLMKAQMVKNAVIVPVGSKGGFVPKHLPPATDREAFLAEGIACYEIFINGLLDLTDNLVAGQVVPPVDVRRFDGDDPYLVVAADKGTATFSDIANAISVKRGFWLSNAFASGGAQGYDHKKMGITARGAWEGVKRHFREMGRDIQNEAFSVIGIGDMSGDVFGNGMLLSKHIKLIAAFDHRDIFIDPDPDLAKSWAERERLFNLPRSSWADYNKKLISKGGGIFSRAEKTIKLTPQLKTIIGQDEDQMAPNALIHALLNAEADLLWFGGIGTYVKAREESHADVGDRANDGIRIDGGDLKFKVVGEGGNLGMTQLGRVDFTANGGRGNTDAIDNSAGVDCSDHEVNIKILLGAVVADGEMTEKQRNRQLQEMTDEVGDMVLRDNYLQTQELSAIESLGASALELQARFIRDLERAGMLDRGIEFLPDEETIAERATADTGLTRPELSVLMAYAKNVLYADLLDSSLTDSAALQPDLIKYFPRPLRKKFKPAILEHQLKREIIATVTANSMVNRLGITFARRMSEETGENAGEVARAYVATREAFGFKALWGAVETLDNRVPTSVQTEMILKLSRLHQDATLWMLANLDAPRSITTILEQYGPGIAELQNDLASMLSDVDKQAYDARLANYIERGVPKTLAQKISALEPMASACDIVATANDAGRGVGDVAKLYFTLGAALGFDWLRNEAKAVPTEGHWQQAAITAVISDLFTQQRGLTRHILASGKTQSGDKLLQTWLADKADQIARQQAQLDDLKSLGALDISKLTLAEHQIARLTRNGRG